MFKGSMVALATPLKNNNVDVPRLINLVDFHLEAGTHALVVVGTTGEAGTLSVDEQALIIKTVVEYVNGKIPVIAGAFANATATCIKYAERAMSCGADALLIMTPAYIKPTQEGLFQHYKHIAQAVPLPIILYNVPSRTACDLLPETVQRLAAISNIIGIKEATGQLARLKLLQNLCGDKLSIYSGDDLTAAEWMLQGAKGVISVTANVVPKAMVSLCNAALSGNSLQAQAEQERLMPLHHLMFVESNPIPVKWALHYLNLIEAELRLPLTSLSAQYHEEIIRALNLLSD